MPFAQKGYDIKFEWGLQGVKTLAPVSDVIIIVDVLSFSTAVDIAVSHGALVYPYLYNDETAVKFAQDLNAQLAGHRSMSQYSLSPSSLLDIPPLTKLVLPSPNGSALSLSTGTTPTTCACLRNAKASAEYAASIGKNISIIAAGEKWEDGSLRPAFEDLIGAGAILSHLPGNLSPESKVAVSAFRSVSDLKAEMKECISGRELIEKGFEKDVELAAELYISDTVQVLTDKCYIKN